MKKNVCNLDCEHCPHPDCIRPEEDVYKYPSWNPANRPPDYRQKQAEARRKRYNARKDRGLCIACGMPAVPGNVKCKACKDRYRDSKKAHENARYLDNKTRGVCVICKQKPATPGRRCCPECAEHNRQYQRQYRQRKREEKKK